MNREVHVRFCESRGLKCSRLLGNLRTAIKTWLLAVAAVLTAALYFAGFSPLVPLFGLAILVMLIENRRRLANLPSSKHSLLLAPLGLFAQAAPAAAGGVSLGLLFLTFLKIGAT